MHWEATLAKSQETAQVQVKVLAKAHATKTSEVSAGKQAARERVARERVEQLTAALAELPASRAGKPVEQCGDVRVSSTDPAAQVMKRADGAFGPPSIATTPIAGRPTAGKIGHVMVAAQVDPARITQRLPQPQGGAMGVRRRFAGVVSSATTRSDYRAATISIAKKQFKFTGKCADKPAGYFRPLFTYAPHLNPMASLQLSGLSSGFDWKTFVDSMIGIERAPAKRMETEISNNNDKVDALDGAGTMLTSLTTAITALNTDGVFDARAASTSGTGWTASASSSAALGSAAISVTQLATAAKINSGNDIGNNLAATNDVSGVTLASLGTGTALTAGAFTVNGARVTVDLSNSLQDLFAAIKTASGDKVTASYSAADDKITLANTDPLDTTAIVLGSSTDTSNFLAISRLANNSGASITSSAKLGAATPTATLANARLKTAITAVDGSGNGSFTLNGVAISYNTGTDTLNSLVTRINAAGAGVTAAFDTLNDKMTLQNTTTGDVGFSVVESSGGLMGALGLTTAASLTRGLNAQFTINGDPTTLTSTSNTLTADAHGITGLSVTATSTGTQTVSVSADTTSLRTKIDSFINSFNAVQSYIDNQTKVTSANGKVTTSTLSDNREIQSWGTSLRKNIFAAVPGLSSTMSQLSQIGIDFTGISSMLSVTDSSKLDTALKERPTEVSSLFRQSSTGVFSRLNTLLDSFNGGSLGTGGILAQQKATLSSSNTSLTTQIADIDRRLVNRRATMEASFIAMETANSKIKSMQAQIAAISPKNA